MILFILLKIGLGTIIGVIVLLAIIGSLFSSDDATYITVGGKKRELPCPKCGNKKTTKLKVYNEGDVTAVDLECPQCGYKFWHEFRRVR